MRVFQNLLSDFIDDNKSLDNIMLIYSSTLPIILPFKMLKYVNSIY